MRARFWLWVMDVAEWAGAHRLRLRALRRASDATDWGDGADCGEGVPF